MKRLRVPSPALVIACIALFVAVSGGTALALRGKNTVDSGDIKPNSVKSSDVGKNQVKGADVKESSLAAVPMASGLGGYTVTNIPTTTLHDTQTQKLFAKGPFTLTARCELNVDSDGPGPLEAMDRADIDITTSTDNSAYDAGDSLGDFDISNGAEPFNGLYQPAGQSHFRAADHGIAVAQDGTMIVENGVFTALNSLGGDGTCSFGGQLLSK